MSIGIARKSALLALALTLLATAACGDDGDTSTDDAAGADDDGGGRRAERVAPARLLPQRHPRPGHRRRGGGHLRRGPRRRRRSRPAPSTPAPRPARRSSPEPSTPPSSAPTRPSTPSPSPTARPSGSSPAPPRAAPRWSCAPDIDSPEDLAGKTLATPSLGNTQDVALRAWLTDEGYETDETGGGDVSIAPQENADTLDRLPGRRHRRRLGARALGHPPGQRGRRPRARRRGRPLARRPVRHHPPLIVAPSSSRSTPTSCKALLEGQVDAIDVANDDAAEAQTAHQRRHRGRSPPSRLGRRDHRRRLGEPDVHRRPDRLVAAEVGRRRRRRRPARRRRPRRHLRPRPSSTRCSPSAGETEVDGL